MTNKDIEESEVGTAKDYAHQIITTFKHLEHGVSYFHDQPVMEAGEEDMMYDIIINALTQHHQAEVERAVEDFAEQLKRSLGNYREYDSPWNDTWGAIEGTKEEVLQSIVTPTKTDKQIEV